MCSAFTSSYTYNMEPESHSLVAVKVHPAVKAHPAVHILKLTVTVECKKLRFILRLKFILRSILEVNFCIAVHFY